MSNPDLQQIVAVARSVLAELGQRPLETEREWNQYQLARGVIDLFDTPRSSTGPVNAARMRALVAQEFHLVDGRSLALGAFHSLPALLDIFDAACSWRDETCSKLPGCDFYDGSHDNDCQINTNMRRLCAAVDKARGA